MAYTVMALYSHGQCSYGLCSHGLYSYGLYSYGLYSYSRKVMARIVMAVSTAPIRDPPQSFLPAPSARPANKKRRGTDPRSGGRSRPPTCPRAFPRRSPRRSRRRHRPTTECASGSILPTSLGLFLATSRSLPTVNAEDACRPEGT